MANKRVQATRNPRAPDPQRSACIICFDGEEGTVDCREQARKIYELCVIRANTTQTTFTYGEVLSALGYQKGVPGHAIRYGLELVLIACVDGGLPILTSIVVNQSTRSPTPATPTGECTNNSRNSWEKEAQKVFSHAKWPDVDEIDWDYVWENRHSLSDKHGIRGYWSNK